MLKSILLVLLCGTTVFAASPQEVTAWESALEWNSGAAVQIPANGITIELDSAALDLKNGTLRVLAGPAGSPPTGFVFEGEGSFRMRVPDQVEIDQLRRFARDQSLHGIESDVRRVVFRSSVPVPGVEPAAAPFTPDALARERHLVWLTQRSQDVDAHIVAALANREQIPVTRVDLDTARFGWLTYVSDPLALEEIRLEKTTSAGSETWISLDREEERQRSGRPGTAVRERFDLEAVDLEIDLRKGGRWGSIGYANVRSARAKLNGTVRIIPRQSGLRAMTLSIDPSAELLAVEIGGEPVSWLRDRIGVRAAKLEKNTWTPEFIVLLPEPTSAGEPIELRMSWELDLPAFAPGIVWYPTIAGNRLDPLTARLRFTTIKRQDVRSIGVRSEQGAGSDRTIEYVVSRPAKMLGFVIGERFLEQEVAAANGVPRVASWGPRHGLGSTGEIRNVAVDVHNSIQFFSWLLDDPLEINEVIASGIVSSHGQSFDGYIQMAEYTFGHDSRGPTELFRAHEVAHQWFGHRVGWRSDRDQWLSESLAEYAAMMFVQATVDGGDRLFNDILNTYTHVLFGSLKGAGGRFARPWLIEMNTSWRDRVGPIGHGVRASTIEVPGGYQLQAYHKGPLVIHMLRVMLNYKHPGDAMFLEVLREYVRQHRDGRPATTDSFIQVLEQKTGASWGWFFDQWVDRSVIPTYHWSWKPVQDADGWKAVVSVRQSGVPETFSMPVPVRFDLPGGDAVLAVVTLKGPEPVEREFRLSAKPKQVTVNPDRAVLAEVRRE